MNKLHLMNINSGSYPKDRPICEMLSKFNNCFVVITHDHVSVYDKSMVKVFTSALNKIEEDYFSVTYQGNYQNGMPFRIVMPGGHFPEGNSLTFGGMSGDEYAVHFEVVDEESSDKFDYENRNDTTFISASESKAEILVLSAHQCKDTNPAMAKDYLKRFIRMITEIKSEFLKFEHIHNLVAGIHLASELSLVKKNEGYSMLATLKLSFLSHRQFRHENGTNVSNTCTSTAIEIIPNYYIDEGFLVQILSHENGHENIQMPPTQMKTITKSETVIELQGFGNNASGSSLAHYLLTLFFINREVEHAELLMFNNIRIVYRQ